MCLAMEINNKKMKILGIIEAFRLKGLKDEDIVDTVVKLYSVTEDYVKALMNAA